MLITLKNSKNWSTFSLNKYENYHLFDLKNALILKTWIIHHFFTLSILKTKIFFQKQKRARFSWPFVFH